MIDFGQMRPMCLLHLKIESVLFGNQKIKDLKPIHYLFIAFLLSYAAMAVVMTRASARINAAAVQPECARVLDLYKQGFTMDEVNRCFDCMGADGLLIYRTVEAREDIIYAFSYACFLGLGIYLLGIFIFNGKKWALGLAALPVLAMITDLAENREIINLISTYPHFVHSSNEEPLASLFNQVKWALAITSVGLLVVFGIWALIKRLTQKPKVA